MVGFKEKENTFFSVSFRNNRVLHYDLVSDQAESFEFCSES